MISRLLLCCLSVQICALGATSGAATQESVIAIVDDDHDERFLQDRLIVTMSGPRSTPHSRPGRTTKRRSCALLDLSDIPCDSSLIETLRTVRHCIKTDSLIVEPNLPVDQKDLGAGIKCIVDYLDEGKSSLVCDAVHQTHRHCVKADPDQIELDPVVRILSEVDLNQWHISAISAYGSSGHNAWDITRGSDDIIVAIIDTGVDYSHADLRTNMWINNGEIPGNGVDDDGNGYVDDVFGFDFVNEDGDPQDDNGHGTHCAGIVGGVVNVKRRVSGVSPNVRVMALKAMDAQGSGRLSDVIAAVEYSLDMGAQITSNSFGTPEITHSNAFARLLKVLEDAGQLYVAAAGNQRALSVAFYEENGFLTVSQRAGRDVDARPEFPASLDSPIILSVAATTEHDALADFSNYGAQSIDLGAPGVNILSTKRDAGYKYSQGTSTATPLVAATAALVLSTISRSSNSSEILGLEAKEIILSSVDPVPQLKDKTLSGTQSLQSDLWNEIHLCALIGGRLNAASAVRLASERYGLGHFEVEKSSCSRNTINFPIFFAIALVLMFSFLDFRSRAVL